MLQPKLFLKSATVLHNIPFHVHCILFCLSVDVTTALINWQALCERYEIDAVDTLTDVPEILYIPTQV